MDNEQQSFDINDDKLALKIHGYIFSSASSDSGKSEFDEDYYKNKPPLLKLDKNRLICIRPEQNEDQQSSNDFHEGEVGQKVRYEQPAKKQKRRKQLTKKSEIISSPCPRLEVGNENKYAKVSPNDENSSGSNIHGKMVWSNHDRNTEPSTSTRESFRRSTSSSITKQLVKVNTIQSSAHRGSNLDSSILTITGNSAIKRENSSLPYSNSLQALRTTPAGSSKMLPIEKMRYREESVARTIADNNRTANVHENRNPSSAVTKTIAKTNTTQPSANRGSNLDNSIFAITGNSASKTGNLLFPPSNCSEAAKDTSVRSSNVSSTERTRHHQEIVVKAITDNNCQANVANSNLHENRKPSNVTKRIAKADTIEPSTRRGSKLDNSNSTSKTNNSSFPSSSCSEAARNTPAGYSKMSPAEKLFYHKILVAIAAGNYNNRQANVENSNLQKNRKPTSEVIPKKSSSPTERTQRYSPDAWQSQRQSVTSEVPGRNVDSSAVDDEINLLEEDVAECCGCCIIL